MKKCKHCKGTNFGVTVTETKVSRYRVINGKAEEMLGEPEVSSKTEIVYCFTCNKPITEEEDTFENETCPVCGKVTEELVNGRCEECNEKVKSYSKMTKEQLIMMMMQQGLSQPTEKVENKENKNVEKPQSSTVVEEKVEEHNVSENVSFNASMSEVNFKNSNEGVEDLGDMPDYGDIQFAPETGLNADDDILSQLENAVPAGSINVLSEY